MNLYGKIMRDRYEQVEYYSSAEYRRRWEVCRSVMEENDVDLLLIVDAARECHDTWVTGRRLLDTIIIPKCGDILGILGREYDEECFPVRTDVTDYRRYTKQKEPFRALDGLRFINYPGPEGIAKRIAGYAPAKIGLVNSRLLGYELKCALSSLLPDAEIKDLKQQLDSQKTIKSEEELTVIRFAAKTLEQIHDILPYVVRPGVTMKEAALQLKEAALDLGANGDLHINIIPLGPMDEPSSNKPHGPGGDGEAEGPTFHKGDAFFTIIECGGIGGHQMAMGRIGVLGKASEEFKEAVACSAAMNRFAASRMKPGNTLGNIRRACEARAIELGSHLRRMCWMHGLTNLGYFEQFALNDYGMEWPLTEGAVLHCHPVWFRKFPKFGPDAEGEVMLLNTYRVTKDGGVSIFDFDRHPFDVIEIDC